MDNTPNEEFSYVVDPEGKLGLKRETVTHVEVYDHEKNFLQVLDVRNCNTYEEIHIKQMEFLFNHYQSLGYFPEKIALYLRQQDLSYPDETEAFLKENLPGY